MHVDFIERRENVVISSHFGKGVVDLFFGFGLPLTEKEILRPHPNCGALTFIENIHIPPLGIRSLQPLRAGPELTFGFVAMISMNGDKFFLVHFIVSLRRQ